MSKYKKIAEEALKKAKLSTVSTSVSKPINESVLYPENLSERMHPKLEQDIKDRKHSLGKHPAFPEDDESLFEEKIMGERFNEVAKRYKRAFDCDSIDNRELTQNMGPLVRECMRLEVMHTKELENLAIKMVREEYDMGEDVVEINATLTSDISIEGTKKNPTPVVSEVEFSNHGEIAKANKEVYKRRFLNAMIQGAAKKCNHMFHMVDDELTNIEPRLANNYTKMMSAADYMYYVIPKMENGVNAGVVRVTFPTKKNPKVIIDAEAMVFPVLIHELVKGVMEILSAKGLPKNKKIAKYVIDKADFLSAEPWDMRLGPALWSKFTDTIEPDDFKLKHHIYNELAILEADEFNIKMKEILAGTKEGKKIIKTIVEEINQGLNEDELTHVLDYENDELENDYEETFRLDDLLNGSNISSNDDSIDDEDEDEDTYDIDDLF